MDVSVIQIGDSKGIRLPETVIEKYRITDTVEVTLEKDCIVIKAKKHPREGWGEAFKEMHEKGDDKPLMPDVFEDEDFDEWK